MEDTYLKDNIKKCVDYVMSKNDDDKRRILNGMFQYNDYLINEQLVVKALNDEEKQEWFNNEIFEAKDKEIERLNKELEKYKYTADELNEIERLNNIIKEVREYIEENTEEKKSWLNGIPDYRVFKGDTKDILEILNKEDNK